MKIIIADDFYTNRLLVKEVLKNLGHTLIEAENGQEVIRVLEEQDDIDVVLMDLEMPVMGGVEAVNHIRTYCSPPKNRVPIVAITAHLPDTFSEDDLDLPFDAMLIKPFSIDRIAEVLRAFEK
jgi:CheY-like chemotaxis protein